MVLHVRLICTKTVFVDQKTNFSKIILIKEKYDLLFVFFFQSCVFVKLPDTLGPFESDFHSLGEDTLATIRKMKVKTGVVFHGDSCTDHGS